MMNCDYCGQRMTSAPSHMDHERECSENPKNKVVHLAAELAKAKRELRAKDRTIALLTDVVDATVLVNKQHEAWPSFRNAGADRAWRAVRKTLKAAGR